MQLNHILYCMCTYNIVLAWSVTCSNHSFLIFMFLKILKQLHLIFFGSFCIRPTILYVNLQSFKSSCDIECYLPWHVILYALHGLLLHHIQFVCYLWIFVLETMAVYFKGTALHLLSPMNITFPSDASWSSKSKTAGHQILIDHHCPTQ